MGSQRVGHDWAIFTLALKVWSPTYSIPREVPTTGFNVCRMFPYRYLSIPSFSGKVLDLYIMLCMLLFSHPVVSNSLQLHGLQHTRPPCPSSPPGVHPSLCPFNWWCHPTISSSVTPFFCPQLFPASWSFPMSRLFESGGQSIEASASASVLPMSIQGNVVSLLYYIQFSSAQSLSHVRLFETPWTAAHQASLSLTNSWSLPQFIVISDAIQPSHPLISSFPSALNLSSIRNFSSEFAVHIR